MSQVAGKILPLLPKVWRAITPSHERAPAWCLAETAGRLTELCGGADGAVLTMAFALAAEAHRSGETAAWVGTTASGFFPPDAADGGVDLEAFAVVRVQKAVEVARAADQLVRSGAFGLLLVDLAGGVQVPPALESRLLGLAQKHAASIVFLSEQASASRSGLGSLVSLRAVARRGREGNAFVCALEIVKDKRHAPDWSHREVCRGPAGLR